MTREEIFKYYDKHWDDYHKTKAMINRVIDNYESDIQSLEEKLNKQSSANSIAVVKKKVNKSELQKADYLNEIKRVVTLFDTKRKSIQKNYIRHEYKKQDGEWILRLHLSDTDRTPQMFIDAIQWLFSKNPKAEFHRSNTMNIEQLIRNFNKIEHDAMHSKEAIKFSEEAQVWANVYKKKGFSEEEILEKLREGGYLE